MIRAAVAAALLSSLVLVAPVSAQTFSSLEERMSAADFRAAGLDKLSADELAKLNDWLRANGLTAARAGAAAPAAADRRGFRLGSRSEPFSAKLVGSYTGESGRGARFTLDNGEVWESTDSSRRLTSTRLEQPKVTLEPGLLGNWYLRLEGYNARITVKRVQ